MSAETTTAETTTAETTTDSMQSGATVNAENPWPGLLAFRETDQRYFQGRRTETEDLFRLVMRERLVVLFGLSGLGKSSLLQAGLFPLVRPHNVLPVYLRLDFSAGAADLIGQVTEMVVREATAHHIEAPAPRESETLWEYFHRDGNHFWNARNRPMMPLLVFDQFEELFTLGRLDGRAAATESLVAQLADLAEGRPPAALKSHIDSHPDEAAGFDFGRHHYKILMSIREDFLPELESLRTCMPALATNRLRLRRMNGVAALDVVSQAPDLIDVEVARQVVRFVAADSGGGPLADVEVEPVLLSVVCRELNSKRLNLGLPRMTAALLEGSQQQVLTDFYERSTADLAPEVRAFIEDHLLTRSGYRDSVAVENALSSPGMTPGIIDDLVGRRLVRREDRGGVQRLELTHDLLAGVVRESRDRRRLTESAEVEQQALLKTQEAERLERQRAREAADRLRDKRILKWSRIAVAVVLVLLVFAVGAAAWAGMAAARATRAERAAAATAVLSAARELSTASLLNLDVDPQLSLVLALAAVERSETAEAAEVLHRALHADRVRFDLPMRVEPQDVDEIEIWPDATGSHVAILERSGKMTAWDLSAPAPTRSEKDVFGAYGTAAVSQDRKMLALASNGQPLRLWSVADERLLAELTAEDASFLEYQKLAFSPSGRFLAVSRCAAVHRNRCPGAVMDVWDVVDRKRMGHWPSIDGEVGTLAWSSDTFLVAGGGQSLSGSNGLIAVWRDTATTAPPSIFSDGEFRDINGIAMVVTDKAASLIYSSPASIDVKERDPLSGDMVGRWNGHIGGLRALALGAGGSLFATASADHTARIWDPITHQERFALRGHADEVQKLAFSGDGKRLVTMGPDMVKVWNVAANGELASWSERPGGALLDLSADGRRMIVRRASELVLVDLMSGTTRNISGHSGHASLSRDGQRLAHGSLNTVVAIEEASTGRPLSSPNTADGFLFHLDFSGNGARLLMITDGPPRVWDVDTTGYLQRPAGIEFDAQGGAISDDGQVVAVQGEVEGVFVWALASGQAVKMSPGANDRARLALSPDGKLLAASAPNGKVIVWDTASGRSVHNLAGHAGETTAIAFSADGRLLASSGADKMTRIWDATTGEVTLSVPGHYEPVRRIAFSSDGKRLTTATNGGEALVYALDLTELIAAARGRVTRTMTPEECRKFLHGDGCGGTASATRSR